MNILIQTCNCMYILIRIIYETLITTKLIIKMFFSSELLKFYSTTMFDVCSNTRAWHKYHIYQCIYFVSISVFVLNILVLTKSNLYFKV